MHDTSAMPGAAAAISLSYCPDPVFVFGSPRSGTTALAHALGKHHDFWVGEETFFLSELFGENRAQTVFERWSNRPSSSWLRAQHVTMSSYLHSLGLGINVLFTQHSQGRRWIDHTPDYVLIADLLARMFPGARFIHLLRDGRQVVHSMHNIVATLTEDERQFMGDTFLPPWATDFREACMNWKTHALAGRDFCSRHPERSMTVVHRDIERNPAATMAEILRFLDARYQDAPRQWLQSRRINSSFQPPGGFDARTYRPTRPWEKWTAEQRCIFVDVAGETLVELGLATPEEVTVTAADRADFKAAQVTNNGSEQNDAGTTANTGSDDQIAFAAPVPTGRTPINALHADRKPPWDVEQQKAWHVDIVEPEFWEIAGQCWPYTVIGTDLLYNTFAACDYVFRRGVKGDVVECGVLLGGTVMFFVEMCRRRNQRGRTIYALDTFTGPLRRGDLDHDHNGNPIGVPPSMTVDYRRQAEENIRSMECGEDLVRVVPGDVVETVSLLPTQAIAILHLDTDTYDTTRAELECLYPRVSPGGVVIVANYGWAGGQRAAVDEYFQDRPVVLFRLDRYCRAFVKPEH